MASRPFRVPLNVTLSANGQDTLTHNVGLNEKYTVQSMYQKTADTTDITDMSDSYGRKFGTMTPANPMDINVICDLASDNNVDPRLPTPMVLESNTSLYITVKDSSGNGGAVQIVLEGVLDSPN